VTHLLEVNNNLKGLKSQLEDKEVETMGRELEKQFN
jgi:hypothetical protein